MYNYSSRELLPSNYVIGFVLRNCFKGLVSDTRNYRFRAHFHALIHNYPYDTQRPRKDFEPIRIVIFKQFRNHLKSLKALHWHH